MHNDIDRNEPDRISDELVNDLHAVRDQYHLWQDYSGSNGEVFRMRSSTWVCHCLEVLTVTPGVIW